MTLNDIRKATNQMIIEQCPWEISAENIAEVHRTIFYFCGLIDMAEEICKLMEKEENT